MTIPKEVLNKVEPRFGSELMADHVHSILRVANIGPPRQRGKP